VQQGEATVVCWNCKTPNPPGRTFCQSCGQELSGHTESADSPEEVRKKDAILVRHCETIGRDEREIERSIDVDVPMIRDSGGEATRAHAAVFAHNGNARPWQNQPVGTAEDVFDFLSGYVELGYRHLVFYFPAPFDEETMTRIANEIRPRLLALITA
jgi:hypothetical protein